MRDDGFLRLLAIFLRLGCTAFGGPVAHLAYFHEAFVVRRRWLSEAAYADLLALCQFLPGPASSQVAIGLGYERAGWRGALAAWLGFTAPGAMLMMAFAGGLLALGAPSGGWLAGLKIAALAVVVHALYGMWRGLCRHWRGSLLALSAALACLLLPFAGGQLLVLLGAGLLGRLLPAVTLPAVPPAAPWRWRQVWPAPLAVVLLLGLPWLALGEPLALFARFYQVGALVFGGGHVVLPLLQAELVAPGQLSADAFLAGYGLVQALPGPLFNLAAYLGLLLGGLPGALLALLGIFLPGALLVVGALPLWRQLALNAGLRQALAGVNCAVVGLLAAALVWPIAPASLQGPLQVALALLATAALFLRLPPWLLVPLCALLGEGLLGQA